MFNLWSRVQMIGILVQNHAVDLQWIGQHLFDVGVNGKAISYKLTKCEVAIPIGYRHRVPVLLFSLSRMFESGVVSGSLVT